MQAISLPPVLDSDELLRWILKNWIVKDEKTGGTRLSSQAFEESSDGDDGSPGGVSLFVAKETSPERVFDHGRRLTTLAVVAVAAIETAAPRAEGYDVTRDPQSWEPAHVNAVPPRPVSGKELSRKRRRLSDRLEYRIGAQWGPPLSQIGSTD
jgi:hypothetical protein